MTTQTPILSLLHACQAAFGTYNLYLASIAIRNLHGYEGPAETAARYSNTAKDQLRQTRTTQASGAIAISLSLLTSTYLLFLSPSPGTSTSSLWLAALNTLTLSAAWTHVGGFWRGKARVPVPGAGDYNEAMRTTQEVRRNLAWLGASWVGAGVLGW